MTTIPLTDSELTKVEAEYRSQRKAFLYTIPFFIFLAIIAPFFPSKGGGHPFLDIAPLPITMSCSAGIFGIFLVIIYFQKLATIKQDFRAKEKTVIEGELIKKRKSYTEKNKYVFFVQELDSPSPIKISMDLGNYVDFQIKQKLHLKMTPKAKFILGISKMKERSGHKSYSE